MVCVVAQTLRFLVVLQANAAVPTILTSIVLEGVAGGVCPASLAMPFVPYTDNFICIYIILCFVGALSTCVFAWMMKSAAQSPFVASQFTLLATVEAVGKFIFQMASGTLPNGRYSQPVDTNIIFIGVIAEKAGYEILFSTALALTVFSTLSLPRIPAADKIPSD